MRSEIAANLNVLEFVKIFGEICKTLGVRWSNRYGVTAPLRPRHRADICITRGTNNHQFFIYGPHVKNLHFGYSGA